MPLIYDEETIRAEMRRLDRKTGYHGADLPIKFGNAECTLGSFAYPTETKKMGFRFSARYMKNPEFAEEEKINLIRHEYAHYMDYMRRGKSSHGKEWKACCSEIDAFPTRCFSPQREESYRRMHENETKTAAKYREYAPGTVIKHPVFGRGTVTENTGDGLALSAVVLFDSGISKTLAVSWISERCTKL